MTMLVTFTLESSIINIDSKARNVVRKVVSVRYETCRTKNGPLRNSSINWIFLCRFLI